MIPGEYFITDGSLEINSKSNTFSIEIINEGDRPIQVGSHYHFYETNEALVFSRNSAYGMRLDIPAGTAVRFEPGQEREVQLVPYGGKRRVFGFNKEVMGAL